MEQDDRKGRGKCEGKNYVVMQRKAPRNSGGWSWTWLRKKGRKRGKGLVVWPGLLESLNRRIGVVARRMHGCTFCQLRELYNSAPPKAEKMKYFLNTFEDADKNKHKNKKVKTRVNLRTVILNVLQKFMSTVCLTRGHNKIADSKFNTLRVSGCTKTNVT